MKAWGIVDLKKAMEDAKIIEFPEANVSRELKNGIEGCEGCSVWLDGWQQGAQGAIEVLERFLLQEGAK